MNVYLVILKDETGKTSEYRVPQDELCEWLNTKLTVGGQELTAVVKV